MNYQFLVTEELAGERIDGVIARQLQLEAHALSWIERTGISRSKVASWISAGLVSVNGQPIDKSSHRVKFGASISLILPAVVDSPLAADPAVTLSIIFEDQDLLVINKPAGLVVHPGAGHSGSTLLNGLIAYLGPHFRAVGASNRPGLVHRLDKDTTGLMVVAKSALAFENLVQQFSVRDVSRTYLAIVLKRPKLDHIIDLPLGRDSKDRKKYSVQRKTGKAARTSWVVREVLRYGMLLELQLATGRTHQIRVHLQAAGSPIVGDQTYGPTLAEIPAPLRPAVKAFHRQALHACELRLIHPRSGEPKTFHCPMPDDMSELLTLFRGGEGLAG